MKNDTSRKFNSLKPRLLCGDIVLVKGECKQINKLILSQRNALKKRSNFSINCYFSFFLKMYLTGRITCKREITGEY